MEAKRTLSDESAQRDGRARILEAAARLFSRRGIDAVSMQQIADEAGVSKATIFHHFRGKDDLYLEVVRQVCEGTRRMLDELDRSPSARAVDQLAEYRRHDLAQLLEHEDLARFILRELTMGRERQARALAGEVFADHFRKLRALVERAQAEGDLRPDARPSEMAVAAVGMNLFLFLVWPVLRHLPEDGFVSIEETAERLYALLLEGMRNRPTEVKE